MSTMSTPPAATPGGSASGVATRRERSLRDRIASINELGILAALVAIILITALFNPDFLRIETLITISRQSSFIAIMAIGTVFLLSMREIDLSVGAVYGLTAVIGALLIRSGLDPWLAGALGVAAGVGLGVINGLVANGLKIATIIATLGTLSVYRGTTLVLADSRTVGGLPRDHSFFTVLGGDFLTVPVSVWVMVVLGIVFAFIYKRTRFGFVVRSIGSNPEAANMSGISVPRIRLMALALQGGLCGVAGVLTLAFFSSADPGLGVGNELIVIASAIIGGTSLAGGTGTVIGAILGALTIGMIRSSLIQFGVTTSWSVFVTGCVVIGAVALDGLIRRRREKHLNQG
jgi:ribose transport system permease protein